MAMTALTFAPAAQAATVKCTPTKATGITPKKIATPKKVLTKFPKKFTLVTNCGNIEISAVGAKAPFTMTSIAALAKGGFYNNTLCHRLTTQGLFVLQCGDPTATGTSGPVFNRKPWTGIPDENLPVGQTITYPAGTLAMANSGRNTNGSQIFFVYEDSELNPYYTVWGRITSGLETLKAIAAAGAAKQGQDGKYYYNGDGFPIQAVEIRRVIVR